MDIYSKEAKNIIFHKTLPFVGIQGWNQQAVCEGLKEAGFSAGDYYRFYDGDLNKGVELYFSWVDEEMLAHLEHLDLKSLSVKERIKSALMFRFHFLSPYKQGVKKILEYVKHPLRLHVGMRAHYQTLNHIWYAAGDQSTDFNFYTKRLSLSAVYMSALKRWLEDESQDSEKLSAFLDARFHNVKQIGDFRKILENKIKSCWKTS